MTTTTKPCTCDANADSVDTCQRHGATTTKQGYTKGPWQVGGLDDSDIFAVDANGVETRIAEIVEDDLDSGRGYCSTEEADANARLIAAAPEMAEALAAILPIMRDEHRMYHGEVFVYDEPKACCPMGDAIVKGELALKKAGLL